MKKQATAFAICGITRTRLPSRQSLFSGASEVHTLYGPEDRPGGTGQRGRYTGYRVQRQTLPPAPGLCYSSHDSTENRCKSFTLYSVFINFFR